MKNGLLCLCMILSVVVSRAQSYHFSQFFSTPLLTNPAYTGFTDGPYRVASNIRTQGMPGNSLFTGYLSAEVDPLRNHLPMGYKSGLGLYIMNDHSLSSAIQTNSIGLSAAYHVGLDTYGEHSVGLGVQGTYNQRRIDYSKLSFENQYGANGFDGGLPVGEPLDVNSKHFFDVNAGLTYNAITTNEAYFAGIAVYNILHHKENLLLEEFTMPTRITLQAGGQLTLNDYEKVYASLTTMTQAKTTELTLGGAYGLRVSENYRNELIGGLWYRFKDAVVPYIGYQQSGFQVGFSFDYTVSGLKAASKIKNAFELTLLYKAADKRELKTIIPWF